MKPQSRRSFLPRRRFLAHFRIILARSQKQLRSSGMDDHHRKCQCGAIYRRSHAMAPTREMSSFECSVCGATLESWNTTWVPNYRLVNVTEPAGQGCS
jgi:hypothetical protein